MAVTLAWFVIQTRAGRLWDWLCQRKRPAVASPEMLPRLYDAENFAKIKNPSPEDIQYRALVVAGKAHPSIDITAHEEQQWLLRRMG